MINEAEEGMVPFKELALRFYEDLGDGDFAALHSVEKSFHSLKDTVIGLGFDRRTRVGIAKHLWQTPEGIEVEGLIREDLKSKGRPSVAGKIIKKNEKEDHEILEWHLMEIGWVLKENDPREQAKGADPRKLQLAETVARQAGFLRAFEEDMVRNAKDTALLEEATKSAEGARILLDKALKAWESQKA